jgi:hypothetical protein
MPNSLGESIVELKDILESICLKKFGIRISYGDGISTGGIISPEEVKKHPEVAVVIMRHLLEALEKLPLNSMN